MLYSSLQPNRKAEGETPKSSIQYQSTAIHISAPTALHLGALRYNYSRFVGSDFCTIDATILAGV